MSFLKNISEQTLEILLLRKKQQLALVLSLAFLIYFGGLLIMGWVNLSRYCISSSHSLRLIIYWKKMDTREFNTCLNTLKGLPHVHVKKVYTPAQALNILRHTSPEGVNLPSISPNPLSYTTVIEVDVGEKGFYGLVDRLKRLKGVEDVIFSPKGLEIKRAWKRMAKYSGGVILIVLAKIMGFVIFVSYSLIRAMREEEIRILWLVGASPSFIRLPIILDALLLTMFSFVLGCSLVKLTQVGLNRFAYTPPLWIKIEFLPLNTIFVFFGVVMLITLVGSYLAVRNIDPARF